MKSYDTLTKEIARIKQSVITAKSLLPSGTVQDMTSIEGEIKAVCENILALPVGDKIQIKPFLIDLMDEMDKYHQSLKEKHGEVFQQLKKMDPQRSATQAYGKAKKIKPPDGE